MAKLWVNELRKVKLNLKFHTAFTHMVMHKVSKSIQLHAFKPMGKERV